MKKVKGLILVTFLMSLWWLAPGVKASLRPLPNLDGFKWANQAVTPAENTFIMHSGAHTEVTPLKGDATANRLAVDRKTNESQALIKNVGFYKGNTVNLLVTLKRSKSNLKGGTLSFSKTYFLGIDVADEVVVTYKFVDEHEKPLAVKTAFNYYGLNTNKFIGYKDPGGVIEAVYANNPTNIMYDNENQDGAQWLYLKNLTAGIPWRDPRQSFEVVTKSISEVNFIVHNNDSSPSSLVYQTEFLAKPETPPAYAEDAYFKLADRGGVYLAAHQTVSSGDSAVEVNFGGLQEIEKSGQYETEQTTVTDFDGKDVSNYFNFYYIYDAKGNKTIRFQAKKNTADQISDTVLHYKIYLRWCGKQNHVNPAKIVNGELALPFDVTTTVKGKTVGKSGAVTTINYIGKISTIFVNEKYKEIRSPIEKKGILTTPFDMSTTYPEVSGYFPVKNDASKDTGYFMPYDQTVVHRYRKKQQMHFELKDKDDNIYVSRFTNKGKVAFSFAQATAGKITLVASCKGEQQVLKEYTNAPKRVTDEFMYSFPKAWLGEQVTFYVEDANHQRSNKEVRTIKQEHGPQMSLPEQINFKTLNIPAETTTVSLPKEEFLKIADQSKVDQRYWTVKLCEQRPLTSKENWVLSQRLRFGEVSINNVSQIVYQGKGNVSLDLSKYLQIELNPLDRVGDYHGELRWTLEDAPE